MSLSAALNRLTRSTPILNFSRRGTPAGSMPRIASFSLTQTYAFELDTDASWRPAPANAARIARNTVLANTTMTVSSTAANHLSALVSMDFFTVSTLTGRVLFVLVLISHERRRIVHVNVTEHPTSAWTAQQLVDAFPEDSAPRYLLRDRDSIYDDQVRRRIASLGITEVVSSPLSPWQNPYVERVIGSIRRECLDHVIILNPRHLRRVLRAYLAYYHRSRTHLGLNKDAPDGRPACAASGQIIVSPEVGGLHHRYDRQAA